jgi:4a-hydroxytetrahydrobiopterin dehydratase
MGSSAAPSPPPARVRTEASLPRSALVPPAVTERLPPRAAQIPRSDPPHAKSHCSRTTAMPDRPTRLDPDAIRRALATLDGWTFGDGSLSKSFDFGDFARATAFLAGLAVAAAELDHHPNWSGVHGRVDLQLSTHDVGGVTELDLELARRAEHLVTGS